MKHIIIGFEVHQPYRLKGSLHWRTHTFDKVDEENLFSHYFDEELNNKLFMTVAERCYLPTNQQILELVDLYPELRFVYSLSGIFIEQCNRYNPSVLDSFKELGETGCVEFLCQTYYHSLSSLFPDLREFSHQVIKQQKLIYDLFDTKPCFFENTEFIYNNDIAKKVEDLGFKGIYTEGYNNKLQSYDHMFKPKSCKDLVVMLRNPDISDILGFYFSSPKNINEPIHVNEVIKKILMKKGQVTNIFIDYEFLGEHNREETGIFNFFRTLIASIAEHDELQTSTPSDITNKKQPIYSLDVPVTETISWAKPRKNLQNWLGNEMQSAFHNRLIRIEQLSRDIGKEYIRIWRLFGQSDHQYYMFEEDCHAQKVHDYFSHYKNPKDAFISSFTALLDFESKLRAISALFDPFMFYTHEGESGFTGIYAWSQNGFLDVIDSVPDSSLNFHHKRGDFSNWFTYSLGIPLIGAKIIKINPDGNIREQLKKIIKSNNKPI